MPAKKMTPTELKKHREFRAKRKMVMGSDIYKRKKLKVVKTIPEYDHLVFDAVRAIRGFNHSEIARASKLSPSTIANMRKGPKHGGTRHPRAETLRRLLFTVGCKLAIVNQEGDEVDRRELGADNVMESVAAH